MPTATNRQIHFFIGIVYICLFTFAILFYFERLNSDAGYYFFHTVNTRFFHIEHGRLVLILAELLPALGSILHLPLKILAVLYSLNHVLFPAILTLICLRKFNDPGAAILITLIQFAGLRYAVFTPQFELFYGLDILVVTLAFMRYKHVLSQNWNISDCFLLGLMMVFIMTSHPMAVLLCCISILLFFRGKEHLQVYIVTGTALLIYIVLKKIYVSEYEQSKFVNFTNAFKSDFASHYLNPTFIKKGFSFLLMHYVDVLLLSVAGIIHFTRTRNYISLALFIISLKLVVLATWIMVEPGNMGRYIEQVYFPFVFLSCAWLLTLKLNKWVLIGISLIFIYRLALIASTSKKYAERTVQMAEFIEKAQNQDGSKFFVTEEQMGKEMYDKGNWSYGFETLIYSEMNDKKIITITRQEDLEYNQNKEHLKASDFLFRPFDIVPIQSLNQQYFKLAEGDYLLLKTDK